tara:strand:+ start:292 stop:1101 length:810 start_codon:yes stop_codon:yes gene_type:complete
MSLTVCIPTFEEELNIKKCLNKLKWAKQIYLLDGNSKDKTLQIAKKFKNTKIIKLNKNIEYTKKLNFLLNLNKKKWVLMLDADYVLSHELIKEIKKLNFKKLEKEKVFALKVKIYNKIFKTIIKENLYPRKIVIFKNQNTYYKKIGHGERLILKSKIKLLKGSIYHENLNDLYNFTKWKKNQINYSIIEGLKISNQKFTKLRIQDSIRRFPPLNIILLIIYLLINKKIFIYKKAGFYYLFQRLYFETLLSFFIIQNYLKNLKDKIFFSN